MQKLLTFSVAFVLIVLTAQRTYGGVEEARTTATRLKSLQCELQRMSMLGQQMPGGSKERKQLEDTWYATAEVMEKERDRLYAMMKTLNESEIHEIQSILFTTCEGKPPIKCDSGTKYFLKDGVLTCR